MTDLKERLARALRKARVRKGLTQEALAEQADVTPETVSNTERAQSLISIDVFLRLAAILDLDFSDISGARKRRNVSPKRSRLEDELAHLTDQMSERELQLLINLGKVLREDGSR